MSVVPGRFLEATAWGLRQRPDHMPLRGRRKPHLVTLELLLLTLVNTFGVGDAWLAVRAPRADMRPCDSDGRLRCARWGVVIPTLKVGRACQRARETGPLTGGREGSGDEGASMPEKDRGLSEERSYYEVIATPYLWLHIRS